MYPVHACMLQLKLEIMHAAHIIDCMAYINRVKMINCPDQEERPFFDVEETVEKPAGKPLMFKVSRKLRGTWSPFWLRRF